MTASVLSVALLVWLVAVCYVVGEHAVAKVRAWTGGGALERAVFAVPLGMGVVAYVVLVFGLTHLLRPAVLSGWLLGGGAVLLWRRFRLRAWWRAREVEHAVLPPGERCPTWGKITLALLAALGLCTLIAALAPPSGLEWDALSYHLAGPKEYLRQGRIFYIPYDHHTNFPFTLQMLYTLMLGLSSVGAAKLCHWLCGALLVASVYTFAVRHVGPPETGRRVGLVAALLVASTPIVLWEASVAYVDLATALMTWLSLYALMNAFLAAPVLPPNSPPPPPDSPPLPPNSGGGRRGLSSRPATSDAVSSPQTWGAGGESAGAGGESWGAGQSAGWLVVSALLMGLALGTKLTVLGFWGMLLAGMVVWGRGARAAIKNAAWWGGLSLVVAAPWFVKSWAYTGNPVYPFFFNLFGGRYWSAQNAALYASDQAKFGVGKTPIDLLLSPWQATMPATAGRFTEYAVFGLSPVFLALVLAAPFLVRRLGRASHVLALFGGLVWLFWFFLMQQTRYLIPALPALAVVGGEALIGAWNERKGVARWLGAGLVAGAAAWGVFLAATQLAAPAWPVVLGRMTTREYVARRLPGLGEATQFINENTPPKAKVALFDEVRGFYLDRSYVWATPNHAAGLIPWDEYKDAADWLADFRRRGYTVLLINEEFAPANDDGQIWRGLLKKAIAGGQVAKVFARRRSSGKGVVVYEIKP